MKNVFLLIGAAVFSVLLYCDLCFAQETGLSLSYPNGGEELTMGAGCIITWTSDEGDIANVKLEYSTDGGDTYTVITNSTENDGAYTWYVPNSLSSNCLVRINDAAGTVSDTSNASFSIVSSKIIVTFPKGEEWLRSGWSYDITWMTIGTVGNVKIEYSTDGGNTYSTIVESTENDGRYAWTVPDINTNEALIKVSEENGTAKDDVNDNPFHILYFTNFAQVTLNLTVQCDTPDDESVCVGFQWKDPVKMTKVGENQWQTTIGFYTVGDTMKYRYCRNCEPGAADEYFEGTDKSWRSLPVTSKEMTVNDTVAKWRWWPADGILPEVNTSAYISMPSDKFPLPSSKCGIGLPDWWAHQWLPSIDSTFKKIRKNTKAQWLAYYVINEMSQCYPSPLIIREGSNGTPEADLIKIISEAHEHGLKVCLIPSIMETSEDPSPTNHSRDWWEQFQAQWREIMIYYAKLAQQYHVEMLGFKMWPAIESIGDEEKSIVDPLAQELLKDLRHYYQGDILVEFRRYFDMNVYALGDYLGAGGGFMFDLTTSKNPTVSELRNAMLEKLDDFGNSVTKWGKPFIITAFGRYSYDGAAANLCEDSERLNPWYPNNPNWPMDLQEQADIYEAFFQAITQKNWISGAFPWCYFYWDSIDKDINIRSKPAEKVVAKWFRWITNRADLNRDGYVDLKDAILSLQIISNMNPSAIRPDYATSHADVNGDARVGLQEAIYILQKVSAIR